MKNKIILLLGGVILVILLVIGSYSWYLYFLKYNIGNNSATNSNNNSGVKVGELEMKEDGKAVYDVDAKSIENIEVSKVPSYNFKIINNGNSNKSYSILIEDIPANLVDDGCTEDNLLTRNDLKYQLSLNGKIIKEDFLSNINDNILDTGTIESKKTNYYSLKVYIHEKVRDWIGKHYHYKIVLSK